MAEPRKETLSQLSNEERLSVYNLLLQAAPHIWSKGELQKEKALELLNVLIPLIQKDPYFLAHLTSYAIKNSDSKDLQVFTTYTNSLSSADGTAFSPGSKYFKPNLRFVSAAAVQTLNPKLAYRLLEIASLKYGVDGILNEARHLSRPLRTALKKYLQYRENNIEMVKGVKKAGFGKTFQNIYRALHLSPSNEVAAILRWQQKDKKIDFAKVEIDFKGLSDLEIAKEIRKGRLPVLGALGALAQTKKKVSPVIAVALLEQTSGNQAVILRKTFEDAGVLKDKEVMELYKKKIAGAKTALDRAKTISKEASEEVKEAMKVARADKRKEQVGEIGKVYLHIDRSGSMEEAMEFAKEKGAVIAELIKEPEKNFKWGLFADGGKELPLPKEFVADAFAAILFGEIANGYTDAFSLYPQARKFGAEVDIFVTDGAHNTGDLTRKIRTFHERHPEIPKPKACVIILFGYGRSIFGMFGGVEDTDVIRKAYEENQIPVAVMKPETLDSSALVAQAVKEAMKGPVAVIDSIMETELLELPNWYMSL